MVLKVTQSSAPRNVGHQRDVMMMTAVKNRMTMMKMMTVLKKKDLSLDSKMLQDGGQGDKLNLKMRATELDVDHIVVAKGDLITEHTG